MKASQSFLQVLKVHDEHPGHKAVGDIRNIYTTFLKERQVGLAHLLNAFAEESGVDSERPHELVEGAKDRDPKLKIEAKRAVAEVVHANNEEANDLWA